MQDTDTLIQRASEGDGRAVQSLLVRHLPTLEAYVRLKAGPLVRRRESIADLVQSVCCDVLRDLGDFEYRGEAPFRNWLFKRALRKILNKSRFYRREKRDPVLEGGLRQPPATDMGSVLDCYATICTPSRVVQSREAVEAFEKAFDSLGEDYREAITLYRIVGLSYPEIAADMGRSEGAVRNLVYRGLARLSGLLEQQQG